VIQGNLKDSYLLQHDDVDKIKGFDPTTNKIDEVILSKIVGYEVEGDSYFPNQNTDP
jgi:hypothetical protein